ncbi:MAG: ISKra4 family transposase [Pseudomonadota bacterium]
MTAVLCLSVYQQQQAAAAYRAQVHAAVDGLLDALEAEMATSSEGLPSLFTLTEAVRTERSRLSGTIVQAYVERRYASYLAQERADCPRCGRSLQARPSRPRTVATMVGAVTLERPYFYCSECRHGFYPLDEALGLSDHVKQMDIQEAACELALDMPYEQAAQYLEKWTDASVSDSVLHDLVGEIGTAVTVLEVCPTREEIRQRVSQVGAGRKWKPILVLAVDGGDVPTRPDTAKGTRPGRKKVRARRGRWKGEWREAKGFRFYLVDDDRIVHLISWHQVQSEAGLGEALRQIQQAGLIPEEAVRLCAIGDGAPWIWKWVQELFPTARQILDYYHCSSYLHAVAEAQYGADPVHATHWLEATMARLFCNEGAGVIWGLQRMKPVSEEAEKAIEAALTYFTPRLEQIAYGSHRKGGYPIGSGAIESAHRFIGHTRLKRSGAWWYTENSNAVLALRCARYNGTLERLFEKRRRPHISDTHNDENG